MSNKLIIKKKLTAGIVSKLRELTSIEGVSSNEEAVSELLIKKLEPICDCVEKDKFGNIIGYKYSSKQNAKTIMLEAHMDRIGLMVSGICDNGSLKFTSIGGIDERILPNSRVCIYGKKVIDGIIYSTEKNAEKNPKTEQLRIDTAMSYETVKSLINIGDIIIVNSEFSGLCNSQFSCGAMDNRSGIVAILDFLEKQKDIKPQYNLVVLFSVQEELGLHGAYTGAVNINCDAAIVVDVTHGTTPDTKNETGVFQLGCGAVICRGPNFDYNYTKQFINLADKTGIPYEIEVSSGPSGTTAWALQTAGKGIPSTLISIPLRYMHSNVETLDIYDVCAVSELIYNAINGGVSFD